MTYDCTVYVGPNSTCFQLFFIFCSFLTRYSQQTQNICMTCVQRRPTVFDVGPTLYECYTNVLCLLGCCPALNLIHWFLLHSL